MVIAQVFQETEHSELGDTLEMADYSVGTL